MRQQCQSVLPARKSSTKFHLICCGMEISSLFCIPLNLLATGALGAKALVTAEIDSGTLTCARIGTKHILGKKVVNSYCSECIFAEGLLTVSLCIKGALLSTTRSKTESTPMTSWVNMSNLTMARSSIPSRVENVILLAPRNPRLRPTLGTKTGEWLIMSPRIPESISQGWGGCDLDQSCLENYLLGLGKVIHYSSMCSQRGR